MNTKRNLTLARDILLYISNNTNNKKFKYIGKSDYYRAKRFKKENSEVICTPFTGQTSKGGIYYALLI